MHIFDSDGMYIDMSGQDPYDASASCSELSEPPSASSTPESWLESSQSTASFNFSNMTLDVRFGTVTPAISDDDLSPNEESSYMNSGWSADTSFGNCDPKQAYFNASSQDPSMSMCYQVSPYDQIRYCDNSNSNLLQSTLQHVPQDSATVHSVPVSWDQNFETTGHGQSHQSFQTLDSPFVTPTKFNSNAAACKFWLSSPAGVAELDYSGNNGLKLDMISEENGVRCLTPESSSSSGYVPGSHSFTNCKPMHFDDSPILRSHNQPLRQLSTSKSRSGSDRIQKAKGRQGQGKIVNYQVSSDEQIEVTSYSNKEKKFKCYKTECLVHVCTDHPDGCPQGGTDKHPNRRIKYHLDDDGNKVRYTHSAFQRQEHLKRHDVTHAENKDFPCPLPSCKKHVRENALNRGDNLHQHLKTHLKLGKNRNVFAPLLIEKYASAAQCQKLGVSQVIARNPGERLDPSKPSELYCAEREKRFVRGPCPTCLTTLVKLGIDWRDHPLPDEQT